MSEPDPGVTGAPVRRPRAAAGGGLGPVGRPPRRLRCPCLRGAGPQLESLSDVRELLPADYSYHVCSYEPLAAGFAVTLRVNFNSERGARDWLAAFQQSSLTTYRSRRTFPRPGPRLVFKAWYRCQRNVLGSAAGGSHGRHTACPAALAISVCSPQVSARADPHLPDSPGTVRLKHTHNHPVRCAADLRFRGVSAAARGALKTLLARGYSPGAARRALQHQLQLQLGERYPLAAADRAVIPTLKDVCRIYYQLYGTPAERRAASVRQVREVAVEQEVGDEEADVDDPEIESANRQCPQPSSSGVPGLDGEDPATPRLELEIVDADGLTLSSVNINSGNAVQERIGADLQINSDDIVFQSETQEGMGTENTNSDHVTMQLTEHETMPADRSEATELIVDQPEPVDLISGSSDQIIELELVESEDLPAGGVILESADPADPVPEADGEPLPSLESLLKGRTIPDPDAVAGRLERLVSEYRAAMSAGGGAAAFGRLQGELGGFAAALTTPLMRRVHLHLPQSGELVFVDSPGRSERHVCCLWLVVCASEAGALPLGLLITSSDSAGALRAALQLWRGTLPAGAFAGRGADGPQVVIVDDAAGQRAALAALFPAALTVICAFRLLQAVWRWLWQGRGRVSPADRSRLLLLARRLLRAGSVGQLERGFREAVADPAMARHKDFLRQFTSIYRHRHLWAVWYGEEEPSDADTGAARTASLFDLAATLLRDRLLFMAAEYGPVEAFDFWTRRGDPYFLQRIGRALSGDNSPASQPRYVPPPPRLELRARRSGPHEHQVMEGETGFLVDLELGCCTCRPGRAGAPCVHQSAAARLERRPPPAPLSEEASDRLRLLAVELPLLEPDRAPLPDGWMEAVTAAAGLPRLEVILSAEGPPPDSCPAGERRHSSRERDLDDLLTAVSHVLQSEDGDTLQRLPDPENIASGVDSAGCDGDVSNTAGADIAVLDADSGDTVDAAGGVSVAAPDDPVDPAEEAMSAAIVALQEVTADLTGRLAADPARYVPLVTDLVTRYWQTEGADGLRAMTGRLTELHSTEMESHTQAAGHAERADGPHTGEM